MEQIGLFDAKNRFSSLVDRVEKGEEIIVTRHGHPAIKLVPAVPTFDRKKARKAAEGLLKLRKGVKLRGLKIKDLQNAGRP